MSLVVINGVDVYLNSQGWTIKNLQKNGSTWMATKHVNYAGETYRVAILNGIVVRDGEFTEDFLVNYDLVVEDKKIFATITSMFYTLQELLEFLETIHEDISKFNIAFVDA